MTPMEFVCGSGEDGARLDAAVAARTGSSRASAARLIDDGAVTVDGVARPRSHRLAPGMVVRVAAGAPAPAPDAAPGPEDIDVPVRFEDEWLLVVAKPAGLVVHPGPGHTGGTLVNALLARAGRPAGGEALRPGIVHRLDAGTSGLMIVAKHEEAYERLSAMMAAREISRIYVALAAGTPSTDTGTIDAPIGRSAKHRKKMAVVAGGRESVTDFRVRERLRDASLLEVRPRTGRTHQIRVHLAAAGHPVVGDPVYGRDRKLSRTIGLTRPFLHAAGLRFTHPMTGERIEIDEPLPADLTHALETLRSNG